MLKQPKTRKCLECRQTYQPTPQTPRLCSFTCASAYALAKLQKARQRAEKRHSKARRQAKREGLAKLMTRRDWAKKAQAAVNRFIRLRDRERGCISCGKPLVGKYDAGHYLSVGSHPELRFNEDNIFGQCVHDNQHKSGNAIEMRKGMIARIGVKRVEWLEGPHSAARYTIEDLKDIEADYKQKAKALETHH